MKSSIDLVRELDIMGFEVIPGECTYIGIYREEKMIIEISRIKEKWQFDSFSDCSVEMFDTLYEALDYATVFLIPKKPLQ